MDPDAEMIITQMGLILTQLRYTRRALEEIERSTSRYSSLAFAGAGADGVKYGAPPLLNGALKVYIVNINDLTASRGADLIEGLLGGIGRFFGGLVGGVAGGTIGGVLLVVMLNRIGNITAGIERIIDALGLKGGGKPSGDNKEEPAAGSLMGMLPEIRKTLDVLTGLFVAASSGGDEAAKKSDFPQTEAGRNWLAILNAVNRALTGLGYVINGLILLIPILIGALASLVARLNDMKLAIVDMLEFALRNLFLLRGIALFVVYDTIASAARLGSSILGILATAVDHILSAMFTLIEQLLVAADEGLRFISDGLQRTMDALLNWLITGIGRVLTFLGDTRIFRLVVHIVQVLPLVLPSLVMLVRGNALSKEDRADLAAAAAIKLGPPSPGAAAAAAAGIGTPPNLALTFAPPADMAHLIKTVQDTRKTALAETRTIFDASLKALADTGYVLNNAAKTGEQEFADKMAGHVDSLKKGADGVVAALKPAQEALANRPKTGLEEIATQYERWLSAGGMDMLLASITEHFRKTPVAGPDSVGTLPDQVAREAAASAPKATVEIQDLVIELSPPPGDELDDGECDTEARERRAEEILEVLAEWTYRSGKSPTFASPLTFT